MLRMIAMMITQKTKAMNSDEIRFGKGPLK